MKLSLCIFIAVLTLVLGNVQKTSPTPAGQQKQNDDEMKKKFDKFKVSHNGLSRSHVLLSVFLRQHMGRVMTRRKRKRKLVKVSSKTVKTSKRTTRRKMFPTNEAHASTLISPMRSKRGLGWELKCRKEKDQKEA